MALSESSSWRQPREVLGFKIARDVASNRVAGVLPNASISNLISSALLLGAQLTIDQPSLKTMANRPFKPHFLRRPSAGLAADPRLGFENVTSRRTIDAAASIADPAVEEEENATAVQDPLKLLKARIPQKKDSFRKPLLQIKTPAENNMIEQSSIGVEGYFMVLW